MFGDASKLVYNIGHTRGRQLSVGRDRQSTDAKAVRKNRAAISVSTEKLSDIVGKIYDCVVEPAKWEEVLAVLCSELSFVSSVIGVQRFPGAQAICQYSAGVDPDWLARMPDFAPDIVEMWGGLEQFQSHPLGEPFVNSWCVDPAVTRTNRFANEWRKHGVVDGMAVFIAKDETLLASLGFNRHELAVPIRQEDVDAIRLLAPHFQRAVTISNLFDMKSIEAATFGSALDSFAFGILLVDQLLSIVHANKAAADILNSGDLFRSDKGRLEIPDSAANAALERAVRQAACDEAGMGPMGIGIPTRRKDKPHVIHVLPLRKGTMRGGLVQRASAALFIAPAASPPRMPIDALSLLYDLTPAEVRIFEMISSGATQSTISRSLGIAPSTVKTHVLHLFEKTGCARQADLLKLAATLSRPG